MVDKLFGVDVGNSVEIARAEHLARLEKARLEKERLLVNPSPQMSFKDLVLSKSKELNTAIAKTTSSEYRGLFTPESVAQENEIEKRFTHTSPDVPLVEEHKNPTTLKFTPPDPPEPDAEPERLPYKEKKKKKKRRSRYGTLTAAKRFGIASHSLSNNHSDTEKPE